MSARSQLKDELGILKFPITLVGRPTISEVNPVIEVSYYTNPNGWYFVDAFIYEGDSYLEIYSLEKVKSYYVKTKLGKLINKITTSFGYPMPTTKTKTTFNSKYSQYLPFIADITKKLESYDLVNHSNFSIKGVITDRIVIDLSTVLFYEFSSSIKNSYFSRSYKKLTDFAKEVGDIKLLPSYFNRIMRCPADVINICKKVADKEGVSVINISTIDSDISVDQEVE